MSRPDDASASSQGSSHTASLELRDFGWDRLVWTFELRSESGLPTEVALRNANGVLAPAVSIARIDPPDHGAKRIKSERVLVRFNVMQGPARRPLDPGTWQVVTGRSNSIEPLRVRASMRGDGTAVPGDHVVLSSARFQLAEGEFEARAWVGAAGTVNLAIGLDRSVQRTRAPRSTNWSARRLARRLLRPVRRAAFRSIFRLAAKVSPRSGRRILFTSDSTDDLTGNLRLIHDLLQERNLDQHYVIRTLLWARARRGRGIANRLRLPIELARADVVVLDDFHPLVYEVDFDSRVKVVQLWHASGAFKTVGYSRVGRLGAPSPYGRAHKNYTHAIVSSRFEVPCYAEAFGIDETRVHPTGIPRMDWFYDPGRRRVSRQAALRRFPAARDRLWILFAPTFRGHGARSAHYPVDVLDFARLHELCIEKDAVFIFRLHPFVGTPLSIPTQFADRLIDGSDVALDINDLLPAIDLLITDYSSVVFEFASLGRPMLLFAFDLEEYTSSRGFYLPYEEFVPGRIVRTFDELLDAVRREDFQIDKVRTFASRHLDHVDGRSAERVLDLLLK